MEWESRIGKEKMNEDMIGVKEMERANGCRSNRGKEMEKEEKDTSGQKIEDGAEMMITSKIGEMMMIGSMLLVLLLLRLLL